jgi:hypothetical protein
MNNTNSILLYKLKKYESKIMSGGHHTQEKIYYKYKYNHYLAQLKLLRGGGNGNDSGNSNNGDGSGSNMGSRTSTLNQGTGEDEYVFFYDGDDGDYNDDQQRQIEELQEKKREEKKYISPEILRERVRLQEIQENLQQKKSNTCFVCLTDGNKLEEPIPQRNPSDTPLPNRSGNLFARLECGHVLCNSCAGSIRNFGGYHKCLLCRLIVNTRNNIILSREDFPELYLSNEGYLQESEITEKLQRMNRIPNSEDYTIKEMKFNIGILKYDLEGINNELQGTERERSFDLREMQNLFDVQDAKERQLRELQSGLVRIEELHRTSAVASATTSSKAPSNSRGQ